MANAFLAGEGLPFSDVLGVFELEAAFARRDALFATDRSYSTALVLWAFLAQTLRDGKGAVCAQAVADIAHYLHQIGGRVPCGDTGDYCRARAKLNLDAIKQLARQTACRMEQAAPSGWLWHSLHPKLVDGFQFTMLDTPQNQQEFPQLSTCAKGVGLPVARACCVLSLATAALVDLAIGPGEGKQTGETALFRQLGDRFTSDDVVVFDRLYRWNVELDIRHIKQTLHLNHVACKSPDMVKRHLWVTLLAYNLIRKVIAAAAVEHDQFGAGPRHLGFTLACQEILASWMTVSCGNCRNPLGHWRNMLRRIAKNRVADRPGRIEPRVLKRRREHYPLMRRPRHAYSRKQLINRRD